MKRFPVAPVFFLLVSLLTVQAQTRGPILTVSIAGGQSTFRIGERIPLRLSFFAEEEQQYQVNTASYDRAGRMHYESFDVGPTSGWTDPLARYFSAGFVTMGGLSGSVVLSMKPTVLSLDLNEWVRFDQPGDYTVTVSSKRVSQANRRLGSEPIVAKASPFSIHVVAADPGWQAARFKAALAVLATISPTNGMQPEPRKNAVADLRYLGSNEAVRWLAAEVRDDHLETESQAAFGLMGVADSMRDEALRTLQAKIDDPGFPVSEMLLRTVATLEASGDGSAETAMRERGRYYLRAWEASLAALPHKEGTAKAATAYTLSTNQSPDLPEEEKAQAGALLAASFLDLSEQLQAMALQWNSDRLSNAGMLPTLKKLATLPLKDPASNSTNDYNRRAVKSAALKRWYQLEPEGAWQEILAEIGSATPELSAESLTFLPELALPQFEGTWAQAFVEDGRPVLAGLLARFGTGSASAQIAAKLKQIGEESNCGGQPAAVAYLVKFDADAARLLLQGVCHRVPLQEVSRYGSGAPLEEAALRDLDDPDPRVTMDALIYLGAYGTKAVEAPIWEHYEKWTRDSAGKGDEDGRGSGTAAEDWDAIGVGEDLARALIANQGWLADDKLIAKVMQGCVKDQVCQQITQVIQTAAGPPYNVTLFRNEATENYTVAQYSCKSLKLFEEKVKQCQKGTEFRLSPRSIRSKDEMALEEEARAI